MSTRKNAYVLDCSVTMSWLLPDEEHPQSHRLQKRLITHNALVPTLWYYEVAHVLCIALRTKRITESYIEESKEIIKNLPIIIDEQSTTNTLFTSLHLSCDYQLSLYDASYLELSMRKGLPLASFDQKLVKIAQKLDVALA